MLPPAMWPDDVNSILMNFPYITIGYKQTHTGACQSTFLIQNTAQKQRRKSKQERTTYEAGGVVVADSLGISKGLEDRIGLEDLALKTTNLVVLVCSNRCQVLDDFLCVLCLSGTRLSPIFVFC